MFRYNNGQFKMTPPASVILDGFKRKFNELTREEWDTLGYNEALPVRREPFTTYETTWVKGEDLIYREEILATTMDIAGLKANRMKKIQQGKTMARDAGFMVGQTLFDSDAGARLSYLELAMKLQADPDFSTGWKASEGIWVTMDAGLYAQVAAIGEAHIAAVFDWQAQQSALIEAAVTAEEVQAVSDVYSA